MFFAGWVCPGASCIYEEARGSLFRCEGTRWGEMRRAKERDKDTQSSEAIAGFHQLNCNHMTKPAPLGNRCQCVC